MISFIKKNITHNHELIARELKQARTDKKIDLKKVAQITGISQKYLEAIEAGEFNKLPPGVYSKNFIKEYAIFLGLGANVLLELYAEDEDTSATPKKQKFFSKEVPGFFHTVNFPKIVKTFSIVAITVVYFFYLGIYLNKIVTPPYLNLSEPTANLVTQNNVIIFSGSSDPDAQIKINEELVLIKSDGSFYKEVNLKEGLNTVIIVAQKKYSKKNEIIRKIFVESEQKP